MLPDFALPNSVPAESEQRVLVRAAEGNTDDTAAVGYGENDLRRTIVGARRHEAISAPIFDCGADSSEGAENHGRNKRE